ncbi:DNA cytosine methyltransferase [Brevibacillus borstelensis]|jgi:DNA (cytosine-5)-methyltransferase 1|uniref:DNA cytosine methyltransferase n=1 Tax=Brevibacillus TaxID=55080 RepID=UPI0003FDB4BF|nr:MULTISPECIES: DNA cytosine methyltransferase [Brevibacillus]NOU57201.1 DNA cytosine methyltransferase [Brevibacillus borstelensis]
MVKNTRDISKQRYTVLSMFSGCGGMDLGFHKAGFEIVWANDINPDACETYSKNIGPIIEGDINDIPVPDIKNLDVLLAGFPCQPFSNAGNRKGTNEERGTLYKSTLKYVSELRPKIVMMENVRGLLSIKTDKGYLIQEICEELKGMGYEVHFKLVNASDYGVPQNRLRVIIVGVSLEHQLGKFQFPAPIDGLDLSIGNCIKDIPENTPNQDQLLRLNPQAIALGSLVPEGGSWKDIPYELLPDRLKKIRDNMAKYRWPNFYRRFHRNEIAGTITAAFKPENAGVWHPIENRVLSAREIARIQSFPDDFIFYGRSVKAIYEMIGNAVPPKLAEAFAKVFIKVLSGEDCLTGAPTRLFSQIKIGKIPVRVSDPEVIYDGQEEYEQLEFIV